MNELNGNQLRIIRRKIAHDQAVAKMLDCMKSPMTIAEIMSATGRSLSWVTTHLNSVGNEYVTRLPNVTINKRCYARFIATGKPYPIRTVEKLSLGEPEEPPTVAHAVVVKVENIRADYIARGEEWNPRSLKSARVFVSGSTLSSLT